MQNNETDIHLIPPADLLLEQTAVLEHFLAITYYGRSGSIYLQHLFDGHPQALTGPYLFRYLYPYFEKYSELGAEKLIERFCEECGNVFDCQTASVSSDSSKSESGDELQKVNLQKFAHCLRVILKAPGVVLSSKLWIQAAHVAWLHAADLAQTVSPDLLVVFALHAGLPDNKFALQFGKDFPNARTVTTLRSPLESMISYFRHDIHSFYLAGALIGGQQLVPGPNEFHIGIRLEDLNSQPQAAMQALCKWLNLPWSDALLTPSIQGKPNNPSQKAVKHPITKEEVSSCDELRLLTLLYPKYRQWNYKIAPKYGTVCIRLLVLPLLVFPLKCEWSSILRWRQDNIRISKELARREGKSRLLKLLMYLSAFTVVTQWIRGRRLLFQTWRTTFLNAGQQLELVNKGEAQSYD